MRKYLIVKIGAIGDVIMALPMIETIRKEYPNAHITWICGKSVINILQDFAVDEIILVDDSRLYRGTIIEKISEVLHIWRKIAFRKFDIIAIGHGSKMFSVLTLFTKANIYKNKFSHNLGEMWPIPGRHHIDEYVRLVTNANINMPSVTYNINFISTRKDDIDNVKKTVVLTPGGAKNVNADDFCRRWPINSYVDLAKKLVKQGYNVILTGSNGDNWVSPAFKGINVVNLIGKTSLVELLAVFNGAYCVVTHDSGPMHLAGMTKCKIIALFGPTNPFEKIPKRENVHVLWNREKYPCCPCYDGKYYAKCENNECLKSISSEDVLKLL